MENNIPTNTNPSDILDDNISNNGDSKLTFSLDIGTRSIVGIIGRRENGIFKVVDYEQQFHKKRAMNDGQIEDIDLVAATVGDVKSQLEKRCNESFTSVSIAAAGRTLKTARSVYEQELDETEEITEQLIHAMEYCAVGLAQETFTTEASEDEISHTFYPVGYSVVSYQLDNYPFSNLLGHRGKIAKIELIAAFLPHNVVQSLYTVTRMNNLDVENLTLEPIAAINVIVPPDIRLLNIAIVDIGAGTSDIAISKNGSIVAYDMVTTAGDEITEAIMQNYLTDFETAEAVKISLGTCSEEITFSDILGNPYTEDVQNINKVIQPVIQSLSESVAQRILDINKTSPVAVFLVGGGSQIPGICQIISQLLKIAPNRVAIGGKQPFKHISVFTDKLQSPEFVTPIGIGVVSSLYKGCDFFSITVNNKKQMLLNYGNSKVLDALFLASIKPKSLIGLSSKSITYYINGEKCVRRGNSSVPGELYVNGVPASIDTKIKQGDEITAIPGKDGLPVEITIADAVQNTTPFTITLNHEEHIIEPEYKANKTTVGKDYIIQPFDDIKLITAKNIDELFNYLDIDTTGLNIELNGVICDKKSRVNNGDFITTKKMASNFNTLDISSEYKLSEKNIAIKVCINDIWTNVKSGDSNTVLFVDMLNYVKIDPKHPQGNIILKLNGFDASYTDTVCDGDIVEIRWDINNID